MDVPNQKHHPVNLKWPNIQKTADYFIGRKYNII